MFIILWHPVRHTPDWKNYVASQESGDHSCSRAFISNEINTAHAPLLAMSSWKIRFRDTRLNGLICVVGTVMDRFQATIKASKTPVQSPVSPWHCMFLISRCCHLQICNHSANKKAERCVYHVVDTSLVSSSHKQSNVRVSKYAIKTWKTVDSSMWT